MSATERSTKRDAGVSLGEAHQHKVCALLFVICLLVGGQVGSARADEFMGYECTIDCSGHEAGYNWAQDHDITDPNDCDADSNSFNEGCRAWAGQVDPSDQTMDQNSNGDDNVGVDDDGGDSGDE